MIAVHAGAGFHSPALEAAYKRDLAAACHAGAAELADGNSALAAVTAAIKVLEESSHCNAGRGSNLSFQGTVECDASVMDGDGTFGAIAAAPGIEHPVEAAALLAQESRQPLSYGRVRPLVLAGDRAREWALSRGLTAATSPAEAATMHLTEHTQRQWRKYRRIVDRSCSNGSGADSGPMSRQLQEREEEGEEAAAQLPKRSRQQGRFREYSRSSSLQQQEQQQDLVQAHQLAAPACDPTADCVYDTVGCVVAAMDGSIAAGVSSGGILLKTEGRVGEAAIYGAGCWAYKPASRAVPAGPGSEGQQQPAAVACSVTGVGEHVIRHLLARECCQAAAAVALVPAEGPASEDQVEMSLEQVTSLLLQRTILQGPQPHDCGLLCLRVQPISMVGSRDSTATGVECGKAAQPRLQEMHAVEVAVAHTAQSMAFGHMACTAGSMSASRGTGSLKNDDRREGKRAATARVPTVHVLRRQPGGAEAAVQTYVHGSTMHL